MIAFLCVSWAAAQTPVAPVPEGPAPLEAGHLHVDAHVPFELLVDGNKLAQLWYAGSTSFDIRPGRHVLRLYVNGKPQDLPIELEEGGEVRVLVGRGGITLQGGEVETEVATVEADPAAPVEVEFRSLGEGAQLRIGKERVVIEAGAKVSVPLAPGRHAVSLRNRAGTVIWATGSLEVAGGPGLIVQITDGRLPELFGPGRFHASGG